MENPTIGLGQETCTQMPSVNECADVIMGCSVEIEVDAVADLGGGGVGGSEPPPPSYSSENY